MTPSADTMCLVDSAISLVRSVLDGADITPLRDFVRKVGAWCSDIEDVLATAGQTVIDEMEDLSRVRLHDVIRRVAQIERDAFAGLRRDVLATALQPALAV
ncbi:MAG TPA: hypothetical protein VHT05_15165 [Candidatus Elarobacter sp.]|nr:hypothetical protein [Candidatus Elarobacter sp.]